MSAPLAGLVVVDLSRMLPGAVLARQLLDLGARLIKVEDPAGDPMRHLPPLVGGIGAGFTALLRGAESACLDLRDPDDATVVRRLTRRADVVVESFRPGTLTAWDLGEERLRAANPGLVWCSLSSFGSASEVRRRLAHDLNATAATGLLELLGGGIPKVQVADVTAGLLAASSVLAALLARARTGRGRRLDQPIVSGVVPLLTWRLAEAAAGGVGSVLDGVLAGSAPCYRIYRCGDGLDLALGALEPKFWSRFVDLLGRPDLAGSGLDTGEDGAATAARVGEALRTRPRAEWLELMTAEGLPVTAVHPSGSEAAMALLRASGLLEAGPGSDAELPGPWLSGVGATPDRPAPRLGEHTAAIRDEAGA